MNQDRSKLKTSGASNRIKLEATWNNAKHQRSSAEAEPPNSAHVANQGEMKEQAVQSEPYILVPHTVTDLDDFVAHPENYLVSMFQEPGRAAGIWRDRLNRNPYGSDGFLSLSYHGTELISAELWDEVTGIWFELIELVEEYLLKGSAERLFPGQPVPLRLEVNGRSTLFTVNQQKTALIPATSSRESWMKPITTSHGSKKTSEPARARRSRL